MAEDGESSNKPISYRPQETFQRAQETQVEHRFPVYSAGVVPLPLGSRGPRSLYLKRNGDSFGFTLRHFIVYPPESITESDGRHAAVGALLTPMDTIFVKNVAEGSSAKQAGLQRGDRIVAVNHKPVTDKTYSQVVKLIQRSPEYLHLLVVPKEEDVLQQYFAETAYNPASNQLSKPETQENFHFFVQNVYPSTLKPSVLQADAVSWKSLQNPYFYDNRLAIKNFCDQRSSEDLIYNQVSGCRLQDINSEPVIHDSSQKSRAQPQVPLYRKMGRRASDGCQLTSEKESFQKTSDYSSITSDPDEMVVSTSKMKAISKTAYVPEPNENNMPGLSYPNAAGCRLSLDGGRRESSSSLTSSLADGSKDSLSSFESTSTLTGQETDDSIIMSRFRKSQQQKEEFLRRPSNSAESALIQREFYSRPKKLEKQVWPPNDPRYESPKTAKPTHQNFQRVKNDIESERDLVLQSQNGFDSKQQPIFVAGGLVNNVPQQKGAKSPKDWSFISNLDRIHEASPAPASLDFIEQNGSASLPEYADERRYPPNFQIVSKRARQFESGRPLPEDDPMSNDRTSFYRSELARLSSKRAVPNVAVRTREFETRSSEPRRDGSSSSANSSVLKRNHRDSRSLESTESNASSGSINDLFNLRLSGNVMISTGSKYIHCPPPSDYKEPAEATSLDNRPIRMRERSNSANSWIDLYSQPPKEEKSRNKIQRQDAVTTEKSAAGQNQQEVMDMSQHHPYTELPFLIPEPVERIQLMSVFDIKPPSQNFNKTTAVRPTQLDLGAPIRPARHLRPSSSPAVSRRSISPVIGEDNNKPVVMRRTKNTNLADEERAMRRESYLKATEGGRMHFDSDLSDGDISPQVLRSAHRRWRPPLFPGDIQQLRKLFEDAASSLGGSASGGSSSSVSLDREKVSSSPSDKEKQIIKEGLLHCKITEIDGKRSADRSWKQIWATLRGPKLYLCKDKHHQSPVGASDSAEQSLSSGVDMRTSVVRIAEDYTKRKHVLRVSSVAPCRSEFLLQADNTVDLADWVKALQEQVAANTEIESKLDSINSVKQQAVPQTVPAQTSIQVQGSSRLSPQPGAKQQASRNRSPTGQSPVCKTRKPPSQVNDGCTSPKSKTWRVRVAKQFRKIHQGASSPSSPTAPEGSTFGVSIENCIPSKSNQYVPKFVEICTGIVDDRGLNTVGIYRVPGNNASVTALTEEVNRNYEDVPQDDARWNDLHVVGSLLKSFFRKMPDSLVTNALYTNFIKSDKIEDPRKRLEEIKRLVKLLPPHNYHTLKHIILHLKKVVENSDVNKMDAKNLAIVFGPTIVRAEEENMQTMVNNMNHQCKIVESLVCYADWFFSDDDMETLDVPLPPVSLTSSEESESASSQALLLDNITKYEALKDQKEKNGALLSSIISAAHRKVKRKSTKSSGSGQDSKEDNASGPVFVKDSYQQFSPTDLKQSTTIDGKTNDIPTTVIEMEKSNKPTEKVPWFNYQTDRDDFHRRIENFELETKAMLQMPRKSEISVNSLDVRPAATALSSSAGNVNQNARLSLKSASVDEPHHLTKTYSASNVFSRITNVMDTCRNSLDTMENPFTVQYANKNSKKLSAKNSDFNSLQFHNSKQQYLYSDINNKTNGQLESANSSLMNVVSDGSNEYGRNAQSATSDYDRFPLRRGSSAENVNCSIVDLNANASLKKIKYENDNDLSQKAGSLDSLNKLQTNLDDGSDFVTSITKVLDEKITNLSILAGEGLPYADESPEKISPSAAAYLNKENIPQSAELYRNPSLHKSQYGASTKPLKQKFDDISIKEINKKELHEKDEDSSENVPDNERHISNVSSYNNNKMNFNNNSKLKRSESLNKPERTVSSLNTIKVKRSESLNKTSDKLKRSDSLTKNEKTESNISKKRETTTSTRRSKEAKLKRKNGMPDRSIKRRHTVGGTKDPDKINWLDNKYQEEIPSVKENCREKSMRTSSPDLSIFINPENMVVAYRQHLMGARPQSFSETTVFKVPLESHV